MKHRVSPADLSGKIPAIASKSDAHRRLILSCFADAPTDFVLNGASDDINATIDCIKSLGAAVTKTDDGVRVTPGSVPAEAFINANESGSTLRFLLPVALAKCEKAHFTGAGRLPERPLAHLINALKSGGVSFSSDKIPLTATGKIKSGVYTVPGNISSQYVTGLLMALPLIDGDSEIVVEGELASKAYVDITLETMHDFGIKVQKTGRGYRVFGNQVPASPGKMVIEGDWSNAAFFLAAGAIGNSGITVTGLDMASPQGDKNIVPLLEKFGAKAVVNDSSVTVRGGKLHACEIDIGETPDLIAPLGAVAAFSVGKTVFYNALRLRLKESDRIVTMKNLILSLGGRAEEEEDKLIVYGGSVKGGECDGANDHRIVMAAAIAGAYSQNGVLISGSEAVNKSYPGFFKDFELAGGKAHVV